MTNVKIQTGSHYLLKDLHGTNYGQIVIVQRDDSWIIGKFTANPAFQSVKQLFLNLEEAANNQIISIIDKLTLKIEDLNLYICTENSIDCIKVYDVQIMNQVDICFKIHQRV